MSHAPIKDDDPTLGKLVMDAQRDISTLISKEIELAKSELKVSVKHGGVGIGLFAAPHELEHADLGFSGSGRACGNGRGRDRRQLNRIGFVGGVADGRGQRQGDRCTSQEEMAETAAAD